MKNKIEDLRDKENPMDIERAKAIAEVAQVLVDSAKAENTFIQIIGGKGSGFIPDIDKQLPPGAYQPGQPRLLKGAR